MKTNTNVTQFRLVSIHRRKSCVSKCRIAFLKSNLLSHSLQKEDMIYVLEDHQTKLTRIEVNYLRCGDWTIFSPFLVGLYSC